MSDFRVKLKSDGEYYQVEAGNHELKVGEEVLVETEHGTESGLVVPKNCLECNGKGDTHNSETKENSEKTVTFIRILNGSDRKKIVELSAEAKTYLLECQRKIDKYNLPMQLLDADLSFDEKKLTFYFTAPSRVDFRILVSELAHTFKKIIRLQQIGSRDEARYLGGVGRCGETICCKRFLKGNFESVTLDMAQDQNLAQMGSNRITGVCGKLMCCLKYELECYQRIKKQLPEIGSEIRTQKGKGVIVSQNVLEKKVTVKLTDENNFVEVSC